MTKANSARWRKKQLSEEAKDLPCETCFAPMALKWSWRREQWFYGCSTWPACVNTFNADQNTGAPQVGQNPPDLRKQQPRAKPITLWDVVLDDTW